jgi:glycosyltransferase involved in cell wall biosynthesis
LQILYFLRGIRVINAANLLFCSVHRSIIGGVETYLRAILPTVSRLGWRLALLFEHDAVGTDTIDRDVPWEKLFQLRSSNYDRVLAEVEAWAPNVVFNNGMTNVEVERQLNCYPVVYFAHNYIGTCISGAKRHGWPSPAPCNRTLGLGCLAHYFPRRCGGLNPITMLQQYRVNQQRLGMLRGCARIQVASEWMRAEYLRHGFAPETVVLNPLFPANAQPDAAPPVPRPMSGIVLLAGRLTALKGGDYLIRAMQLARAKAPHAVPLQLMVAGDGPELAGLRNLAESLGVPTHFHGWVDAAGLEALMRQADLLAMPSLWPEPFGLLGPEAGCVGLPSVGYAHGGIPDWLVEGESGTLAPSPPTVEGLADAILRAVNDAERHQALRVGAWQMAKRFNAERHVRLLEAVLREAATGKVMR